MYCIHKWRMNKTEHSPFFSFYLQIFQIKRSWTDLGELSDKTCEENC